MQISPLPGDEQLLHAHTGSLVTIHKQTTAALAPLRVATYANVPLLFNDSALNAENVPPPGAGEPLRATAAILPFFEVKRP
jgi:hypothetical protein